MIEINITIKTQGEENTRRFTFTEADEAHNKDWSEAVQDIINDMEDYLKDK